MLMSSRPRSITRELPDNIPFEAKSFLIKSFQQSWQCSMITCFDRVREAMVKILNETISLQFERYGYLQSHLWLVVSAVPSSHV